MPTSGKHRRIIVGVDGSPAAKVAVDWAARDAAIRHLPLTLVHVAAPPLAVMWPEPATPAGFAPWHEERGREIIRDAREVVEESMEGSEPIEVDTEIVTGTALPTLVDLSKDAAMIVVGCRGRGAISRTLLGSVSSGLVQHAHCPIAVIHDEDPLTPSPAQAPVLVGIDGTPASELATAIAFDEASRRNVDLVALHAWSDWEVYEYPGIDWPALQTLGEEILSERLAGWKERYPDVSVRREVVIDRPAHQLVERSAGAQLVVVGSHGRGGFAAMLIGSVSSAVAQSARTPVIVARQS